MSKNEATSRVARSRNSIIHPKIRSSLFFRVLVATFCTLLAWPITAGLSAVASATIGLGLPMWASLLLATPLGILYLSVGSED